MTETVRLRRQLPGPAASSAPPAVETNATITTTAALRAAPGSAWELGGLAGGVAHPRISISCFGVTLFPSSVIFATPLLGPSGCPRSIGISAGEGGAIFGSGAAGGGGMPGSAKPAGGGGISGSWIAAAGGGMSGSWIGDAAA